MTTLHLLWHFKIDADDEFDDDDPEMKLIGIYSSEINARAAIARLTPKPGFRDWPGGFRIFSKTLDRDSWSDGFVSADDDGLMG